VRFDSFVLTVETEYTDVEEALLEVKSSKCSQRRSISSSACVANVVLSQIYPTEKRLLLFDRAELVDNNNLVNNFTLSSTKV